MEAQLHDGTILEFPDGTDPSVIQATVRKTLASRAASKPIADQIPGNPPTVAQPVQPDEPTLPERIAANSGVRFFTGASAPIRGVLEKIPGSIGQSWKDTNQQLSDMQKRGLMNASGAEKFASGTGDLAGQVLSPASLGASKIAPAATVLGRTAQNAGVGGAFGLMAPTGNEGDPLVNGGIGAAAGVAVPAVLSGATKFGHVIRDATGPVRESWRTAHGNKFMREKLGPATDDVIDAITRRGTQGGPQTTADLIAGANAGKTNKFGSPLVAIEDQLIRQPGGISDAAKSVWAKQEAGRRAALAAVTPDEAAAVAARTAVTAPMREAELNAANVAGIKGEFLASKVANRRGSMVSAMQDQGRFATEAAQAGNRAQNFIPVLGQPRIAARYSPNADRAIEYTGGAADTATIAAQRRAEAGLNQYQLDSIAAHGMRPLETSKVIGGLDSTLNQPGIRASDLVQQSVGYIRDKLASLTNDKGVINAHDLYTVRKEIGNKVTQLAKENGNWDQRMVSGIQRDIQQSIDDAIESAGGSGWKNYLDKYAEMSVPVSQSKVLTAMQDVLSGQGGPERVTPFMNVLGRGEQALLKKSTGFPRYQDGDLGKVLTGPGQMEAVNKVAGELTRDLERKALGQSVDTGNLFNIADRGKGTVSLPNLLSRPAMLANFVMKRLGKGADEMITQDMGNLMVKDPAAFAAKYLKEIPISEQRMVIEEIARRGKNPMIGTVGMNVGSDK